MRTQTYQQKLKAHIKILTPLCERLLAATFGKFVSALEPDVLTDLSQAVLV